jgi:signal peptidase II
VHKLQGARGKNETPLIMQKKWKIFAFVVLAVIIGDQVSKQIVSRLMYRGQTISIIPQIFGFTYVQNPNAAFGIPIGTPIIMMILTSVATALLIFYFTRLKEKGSLLYVGLSLIIGGAIGNLIDRFRMHQVIDFIELGFRQYKWPVFNIADSCVTIGIIAILWSWIFGRKAESAIDKSLTN